MNDAACNVGAGNGIWILVLAILGGGFSVILAGLVAGKTKADMAERLFEQVGLNKREAKDLVELFFEEIRGALEKGEQVK